MYGNTESKCEFIDLKNIQFGTKIKYTCQSLTKIWHQQNYFKVINWWLFCISPIKFKIMHKCANIEPGCCSSVFNIKYVYIIRYNRNSKNICYATKLDQDWAIISNILKGLRHRVPLVIIGTVIDSPYMFLSGRSTTINWLIMHTHTVSPEERWW